MWGRAKQQLVREQAILLIKWLRPKGLKVWSYVEKYAKFRNQTLKKNWLVHKNAMRSGTPPGSAISQISTEMGYPMPQNLIWPTLHPHDNFLLVQKKSSNPSTTWLKVLLALWLNYETPGRQTKQSNQSSLPYKDDCKTRMDTK